jgi:hypothetical protein
VTPAALLDLARATGAEITIAGGRLATRGLPPELRADVLRHQQALRGLLQRPPEPTAAERRIIAAVEAYAGWWPLSVSTLCRALAAQTKPLASTPTIEFVEHLDAVTPEHEASVRRIAQGAIAAGLIPERAVRMDETGGETATCQHSASSPAPASRRIA